MIRRMLEAMEPDDDFTQLKAEIAKISNLAEKFGRERDEAREAARKLSRILYLTIPAKLLEEYPWIEEEVK